MFRKNKKPGDQPEETTRLTLIFLSARAATAAAARPYRAHTEPRKAKPGDVGLPPPLMMVHLDFFELFQTCP